MNKGYFVSEAMMSLGKKYFAITIESWWGYIRTGSSALKLQKMPSISKGTFVYQLRIPQGKKMENHGKKNILFCLNKISRDSQCQLLSIEIFEDAHFT